MKNEENKDNLGIKHKILNVIGKIAAFIGVTVVMLIVLLYFVMFICIKGPSERIRDLFVLSVRESSAGGFLADIYLSKEEISAIEDSNKVEETDEMTDTSIVSVNAVSYDNYDGDDETEPSYIVETMYDSEIVVEDGIELHYITGSTFTGMVAVVPDPSRVFIGTSKDYYDGTPGLSVPDIAERYNSVMAINGAFFVDTGGVGNGGTPIGFVFSEGENKFGGLDTVYAMLGFNNEGILMCGNMTGEQAMQYGIRDGLSCDPFLIINGEITNVAGSGGGLNPRTALGQRADGAVILLVIDGRQATSLGASMSDLQNVMLAFGAVNAGNLDGGGSTVMYYKGEILNTVMSIYGARGVPDAVCVRPLEN